MLRWLILGSGLCGAQKITKEKVVIPITANSGAEFTVPRLRPHEPPESKEPFPNTHSLEFKDRKLDRFGFPSLGLYTPVGDSAFEAGARRGVKLGNAAGFAQGLFSTLAAAGDAMHPSAAARHPQPPAVLPSARLPHHPSPRANVQLFGLDVPVVRVDAPNAPGPTASGKAMQPRP